MPQVIVKLWPEPPNSEGPTGPEDHEGRQGTKAYQPDIIGNAATLYKKPGYPM